MRRSKRQRQRTEVVWPAARLVSPTARPLPGFDCASPPTPRASCAVCPSRSPRARTPRRRRPARQQPARRLARRQAAARRQRRQRHRHRRRPRRPARPLREIAVGDKPEGVTWVGNGPLAAVTVYRDDQRRLPRRRRGQGRRRRSTVADEPYGIVATKDGKRAWVTPRYPGMVSEIDLDDAQGASARSRPAQCVRGIALCPDEKTALRHRVLHRRSCTPSTCESGKVVDTWKGHATDNLCRHVVAPPEAAQGVPVAHPLAVDVDRRPRLDLPAAVDLRPGAGRRRREAARVDRHGHLQRRLRQCQPVGGGPVARRQALVHDLRRHRRHERLARSIDDDYKEIEPHRPAAPARQEPAGRPRQPRRQGGLRLQHARLRRHRPRRRRCARRWRRSRCASRRKSPEWVRGKVLFNHGQAADDAAPVDRLLVVPPGRPHDGRVWQNPEGLRKTPPLFGLAHTHPLHWSADRDEVQDFEYTIRGQLMRGPRPRAAGRCKPQGRLRPDRAGREDWPAGRRTSTPWRSTRNSFDVHAVAAHPGAGQAVAGGRARQGAVLRARRSAARPATAGRTTPTAR